MTVRITTNPMRVGNRWVFPDGRTLPVISGGAGEDGTTVVVTEPPAPSADGDSAPTGEQAPTGRVFTEEEVAEIRRQEKAKLYPELTTHKTRAEQLEAQLADFQAEQQRIADEAAAERQAAEDARVAREEAEMEAKDLLLKREEEWKSRFEEQDTKWSQQFEELNARAEAQEAMLEKERAYQALETYKQAKIQEAGDSLMPHLLDLIGGSTEQEIDASISAVAAKTSAIMEDMQEGLAARQGPRAVPTTGASPTGPLENQQTQQHLTSEDIRNMSIEQYEQYRPQLLAQARPQ